MQPLSLTRQRRRHLRGTRLGGGCSAPRDSRRQQLLATSLPWVCAGRESERFSPRPTPCPQSLKAGEGPGWVSGRGRVAAAVGGWASGGGLGWPHQGCTLAPLRPTLGVDKTRLREVVWRGARERPWNRHRGPLQPRGGRSSGALGNNTLAPAHPPSLPAESSRLQLQHCRQCLGGPSTVRVGCLATAS